MNILLERDSKCSSEKSFLRHTYEKIKYFHSDSDFFLFLKESNGVTNRIIDLPIYILITVRVGANFDYRYALSFIMSYNMFVM